jgi:ATP-binding cassette subfamily F protein uup
LQKIADRIIELDRGKLYDWKCDYKTFLERKDAWLESEQTLNILFDKKLAAEEVWIRKGIKARRTRNEGRVSALKKMRNERAERRDVSGSVKMQLQKSDISGKMIIEAEEVSFKYDTVNIIRNFSTRIIRGAKIGIIGPNGCGKSTLIKLLLNDLQPDSGSVKTGAGLQVVYYDQLRNKIDLKLTVKENIMGGSEVIDFNGRKKHVIGYLSDFLFPPSMADMKTEVLSGGEKNRLMLAKLFTSPFNFLVMDEPTNDLDIETIELLEELLLDYDGTLLLVSHDRTFVNNIVNSVFAFDSDGIVNDYAGGYDDWLSRRVKIEKRIKTSSDNKGKREVQKVKTKLSMKEKKELEDITGIIEAKENRKKEIFATLADPSFYQKSGEDTLKLKNEIDQIDGELEKIFARWEELDAFETGNN